MSPLPRRRHPGSPEGRVSGPCMPNLQMVGPDEEEEQLGDDDGDFDGDEFDGDQFDGKGD